MIVRTRLTLAAVAALACAGLVGTAPASADNPKAAAETPAKVAVLTSGLNGPRQLSSTKNYLYTTESDIGQVTRVAKDGGARKTQLTGIAVAQGVLRTDDRFYLTSGEPNPDDDPSIGGAQVLVAKTGSKPKVLADLLKYELTYNPDNQTQFDSAGEPVDALSNPYYVIRSKSKGGFLLVADAGGNDVLAVSKSGKVSTFFLPTPVTTGACSQVPAGGNPQNSTAGQSCDAVPTGLAYGPNGNLYVSALTGEVAGQGRVYIVDPNGKQVGELDGFSGPTGVAVDPEGNVYVSELLQGLPEDGARQASVAQRAKAAAVDQFDPSTVGQIVKVGRDGKRTYAQVTMPSGLLYTDGKLYASAWSIASLFQLPNPGQIVAVFPSSFVAK